METILIKSFRVPSKSQPGVKHKVDLYSSGDMQCNCFAGEHQRTCRHMKIVYSMLSNMVKAMSRIYDPKKLDI